MKLCRTRLYFFDNYCGIHLNVGGFVFDMSYRYSLFAGSFQKLMVFFLCLI